MKIKGTICVIISAISYGFTPVLARITYDMGNNGLAMTFFRSFFAIPMLLVVIRLKKLNLRVDHYSLKNIALVSIFGVTATTALLYSTYSYIGVGTATTLHFLYPVFVALISKFALNEYLGKKKIVTLVIACIGIFHFMEPEQTGNLLGVFMATLSALTYAYYMVWMEKKKLVKISPYILSLYIAVFVSLTLIVGNIFLGYISLVLPLKAYLLMITVSFFTSFLAMILLQIGLRNIGSTSTALFSLFEPITSVVVSTLFLKEAVTIPKVIGCTIIFLAIAYLAIANRDESQQVSS